MKKVKIIAVLLLMSFSILAQEKELIIKDNSFMCGTTINGKAPAEYNDTSNMGNGVIPNSWSAMRCTVADMVDSKKIKTIGFYIDCGGYGTPCDDTADNQIIYMKLIDPNIGLSNGKLDMDVIKHPDEAGSGYTKVFEGTVTWTKPKAPYAGGPGITPSKIVLDTPFEYDNTKDLIIYYKNQNGDNLGGVMSCNGGSPSFLSYPTHLEAKVGNAGIDGTRKENTTKDWTFPFIYFGYEDSTPQNVSITMPTADTICGTEPYEISGTTVSPTDATLNWSTDGSGQLSNGGTLTPTYTPSATETGTITFTLTAEKGGKTATGTFSLTVKEKPVAKIIKKQ